MSRKKILRVLSTTAIAGLLMSSTSSTVFAKATKIAVNGKDGKVYEYKYNELETSYLSQMLKGSNDPGSKFYNDFLHRQTTINAVYDDVKKAYVDFNIISKATIDALASNKPFNLTSFMESPTTPITTITANPISVDTKGNLVINGQTSNKPEVKNVSIIDSETIRVVFNKKVDFNYASNKSNYALIDSDNIDISHHIRTIYNSISESNTENTDTFLIKLEKFNPYNPSEDWRLTSAKYTLNIKNIVDTALKPNTMNDCTQIISGTDTVAPKGTEIYAKLRNSSLDKDKVIIYFTEAMDLSTLTNKDNYHFVNGEGDTKSLPSETTISSGGDQKSAIIEFPTSYHVKTTGKIINGSTNDVTTVRVSNVKDLAGNVLDSISFDNCSKINIPKAGAQVK